MFVSWREYNLRLASLNGNATPWLQRRMVGSLALPGYYLSTYQVMAERSRLISKRKPCLCRFFGGDESLPSCMGINKLRFVELVHFLRIRSHGIHHHSTNHHFGKYLWNLFQASW